MDMSMYTCKSTHFNIYTLFIDDLVACSHYVISCEKLGTTLLLNDNVSDVASYVHVTYVTKLM